MFQVRCQMFQELRPQQFAAFALILTVLFQFGCQSTLAKISVSHQTEGVTQNDQQDFQLLPDETKSVLRSGDTHADVLRTASAQSAKLSLVEDETTATAAASAATSTTEDIISNLLDDNYLDSINSIPTQKSSSSSSPLGNKEKISNLLDELQKSSSGNKFKRRQQQQQQQHNNDKLDWWTKLMLANKNKNKNSFRPNDGGQKVGPIKPVYREQPLSQNVILTARYQLMAIRDKHKLLLNKSIPQLMRLDQRLIETYRLCFKRNQPLYGGMLYRTRDYVIRLARDVKHERQILEAMTKQIQKVLKDRAENKTLVREFNRLNTIKLTEMSVDNQQQQFALNDLDQSKSGNENSRDLQQRKLDDSQQQEKKKDVVVLEQLNSEQQILTGRRRAANNDNYASASQTKLSNGINSGVKNNVDIRTRQQNKYTVHINEVNIKKQLQKTQALVDRINASTHDLHGVIDDIVFLMKFSTEISLRRVQSGGRANKPMMNNFNNNNNLWLPAMTEQKKVKKMLKSPIKNFLERYGKLTMGNLEDMIGNAATKPTTNTVPTADGLPTTPSAAAAAAASPTSFEPIDVTNLPEPKPLFDAASLVYTEPPELEIGFESPVF